MSVPVICFPGGFPAGLVAALQRRGVEPALPQSGRVGAGDMLLLHGEVAGAVCISEPGEPEALAERLIADCAAADPCWLPYARLKRGEPQRGGVTLALDGAAVPLLPFVQDMLRGAILGMVATLKDTGLAAAETLTVELRLGKEKGE